MRGPAGNGAIVSVPVINGANPIANGHANGTASVPRTCTLKPLPALVPSTSVASNEAAQPMYAGGVWTNCFIGGWGEALHGDPSVGWGEQVAQMSSANGTEDDRPDASVVNGAGDTIAVHSRSSALRSSKSV